MYFLCILYLTFCQFQNVQIKLPPPGCTRVVPVPLHRVVLIHRDKDCSILFSSLFLFTLNTARFIVENNKQERRKTTYLIWIVLMQYLIFILYVVGIYEQLFSHQRQFSSAELSILAPCFPLNLGGSSRAVNHRKAGKT